MIRELFEFILENYLVDKAHYASIRGEKKLSELPTYTKLVKELPSELKKLSNLNNK